MKQFGSVRILVTAVTLLSILPAVAGAQQPERKFTNLKVFPTDIKPDVLLKTMGDFSRALGVRCTFCHVGDDNLPSSTYHFADDSKATKRTARVMMRMVDDVNGKYLSTLEDRAKPATQVQCMTCHRGVAVPRTLQSILLQAHDTGGLDSTIATYHSLRDRYYGRAAYDFGAVPLADVATAVTAQGHPEDGVALNQLNLEVNPESDFAKRQYVGSAVLQKFRTAGADSGTALYRQLKTKYGAAAFPDFSLNQIGYGLLEDKKPEPAVAAFKLGVEAFPDAANSYDSLGDGYAALGDRKLAMENYEKALKIAPSDETKGKLDALRKGKKK